ILTPEIFDILSVLKPGKGGEIQLTDGIMELGLYQEIIAYEFEGRRYDVGDKLGFVEATIDYALRRGDLSDELMNYLRDLVRKTES
ncbi:MAG: UTP--glucose-1-phosphate uridylyltransferase, partial [Mobilitalea sp.]